MQQLFNTLKWSLDCTKNLFTGACLPRQGWGLLQWISRKSGFTRKCISPWNQYLSKIQGRPGEFSWDDKTAGAQLLLWELTQVSHRTASCQIFLQQQKLNFFNNFWGALHSSLIIFVFRMKNTEEMFRYLDLNNQNNAIAFWSSFYLPNILLPHLMPGYKWVFVWVKNWKVCYQ